MKNKTMMFKQDRKRFWKNFTISLIKINPGRVIILPISLIAFALSLSIDDSIFFREVYRYFESKDGTHYYVLGQNTVESATELEIFEDSDGSYIKEEGPGEGKMLTVILSAGLLIGCCSSFFIEDLEIERAVGEAILRDVKLVKSEPRYVYTAYSKKVLETYRPTSKFEMQGMRMTVAALMELEDHIEKVEMREKKLEEIGI
jgi:hypothetical protein